MAIKLRVVGIFYRNTLEFGRDATVAEILHRAVKEPGFARTFGFRSAPAQFPGSGTKSISAFYADYHEDIESESSPNVYPAGEYFLEEATTPYSSDSVWQYYMFDKDGKVLGLEKAPAPNPTTPTGGVFDYYDTPNAIVPDGGSVVWRLVRLLTKPNPPSPFAKAQLYKTPDGQPKVAST